MSLLPLAVDLPICCEKSPDFFRHSHHFESDMAGPLTEPGSNAIHYHICDTSYQHKLSQSNGQSDGSVRYASSSNSSLSNVINHIIVLDADAFPTPFDANVPSEIPFCHSRVVGESLSQYLCFLLSKMQSSCQGAISA
jgi:hypothetical protein